MNLKKLTNKMLDEKVIEIAKREKELVAEAVIHIAEVERRKMYLDLNYSSLFAYLTKHAGFSNGSAYRFMDAAHLQLQAPALASKIETGEINLSQVRVIQEASRQKKKEQRGRNKNITGKNTTQNIQSEQNKINQDLPVEKSLLLESLSGLSVAESQVLVSQAFDIQLKEPVKETHQKDESVHLTLTFSKEQWAELMQAKENLSTTLPTGSWAEVFAYLAKQENQKKSKESKPREGTATLTPAKKNLVRKRDQCCQSRHPETGEICGSTFNTQVDHIIPVWAGGSNEISNLQLLCAAHNQHKYRKQAGISQQ